MPWWSWVALWVALVLGAVVTFVLLARSLWRSAVLLLGELEEAAERFGAVADQLDTLATGSKSAPVAVFQDPVQVRMERDRLQRARRSRRRERAASGPRPPEALPVTQPR